MKKYHIRYVTDSLYIVPGGCFGIDRRVVMSSASWIHYNLNFKGGCLGSVASAKHRGVLGRENFRHAIPKPCLPWMDRHNM